MRQATAPTISARPSRGSDVWRCSSPVRELILAPVPDEMTISENQPSGTDHGEASQRGYCNSMGTKVEHWRVDSKKQGDFRMAGSVNKVILVGNLGRDPEVRRLGSGEPVVNLRVATSESWKDKNSGERKEKTEWHSVVIFNENLAKVAEQYLRKGAKVYLEGALQTRKWTDKEG